MQNTVTARKGDAEVASSSSRLLTHSPQKAEMRTRGRPRISFCFIFSAFFHHFKDINPYFAQCCLIIKWIIIINKQSKFLFVCAEAQDV